MAVCLSEEFVAPSDPAVPSTAIARAAGSTDEESMPQKAVTRDPARRVEEPIQRMSRHDRVRK